MTLRCVWKNICDACIPESFSKNRTFRRSYEEHCSHKHHELGFVPSDVDATQLLSKCCRDKNINAVLCVVLNLLQGYQEEEVADKVD